MSRRVARCRSEVRQSFSRPGGQAGSLPDVQPDNARLVGAGEFESRLRDPNKTGERSRAEIWLILRQEFATTCGRIEVEKCACPLGFQGKQRSCRERLRTSWTVSLGARGLAASTMREMIVGRVEVEPPGPDDLQEGGAMRARRE